MIVVWDYTSRQMIPRRDSRVAARMSQPYSTKERRNAEQEGVRETQR